MEQVRSTVTNFFGRVPLSYTRFSLTQQADGDSSQVEMKLADDEEECGDHVMADNVVKHRKGNNCKGTCFKILAASLLFLTGFLIGYLSYRGRVETVFKNQEKDDGVPESSVGLDSPAETDSVPEMSNVLHWGDLQSLLSSKTDNLIFKDNIRKLTDISREAGSVNEESMALMMHNALSNMSLDKVWNDEHYVRLQVNGDSPNKITIFKNDDTEDTITPTSYVAYSASGTVSGGLLYCHYGRKEDFKTLQDLNIDFSGSLVLVRSGLISFSEKVKNAELAKALGVLIYPEPSDFTFPMSQSRTINSPFGHAHYGTGDPYTPGFPSFNNTQFPSVESSGLPKIPVQTISSEDGRKLLQSLGGAVCPSSWKVQCMLGPQLKDAKSVKLDVKNVLADRKIYNVFGVLRGFDEPDRYVVVGAQRDAQGPGAAKSAVGSSILLKLASMLSEMVKTDGYRPKRSIVFASWGASEFGSVGATEWLEGYLTTLHLKAISYISLDSAVQGNGAFSVSASPLMYSIVEDSMKEVKYPTSSNHLYPQFVKGSKWTETIVTPFTFEDTAYPFLTYSGIPSVSFRFQKDNKPYAYLDTDMDTLDNLENLVDIDVMCRSVAEFAGQMVLRLTHWHKLPLEINQYSTVLLQMAVALFKQYAALKEMGLSITWISSARGDFKRAAESLNTEFSQSDLDNKPFLRSLNDRIMKVEHNLLSPYASPNDTPFRHIIYGSGNHTFVALMEHLDLLNTDKAKFDRELFKKQLAMLTWTIQGAANGMAGEIWEIDNEF
ncbi:transferrin receptor protein 1 [Spea bombifrons]|uniref:transferrin receptor protein 1 n=1 Tax=Spea bombifrons TaxID=233779 RepID=UPI00234960AA|nr:transferrin receptor protein 1 [Spea bombifrons]XP_053316174.1 transferrin receptor protein 1 [Spea bombifrons]